MLSGKLVGMMDNTQNILALFFLELVTAVNQLKVRCCVHGCFARCLFRYDANVFP